MGAVGAGAGAASRGEGAIQRRASSGVTAELGARGAASGSCTNVMSSVVGSKAASVRHSLMTPRFFERRFLTVRLCVSTWRTPPASDVGEQLLSIAMTEPGRRLLLTRSNMSCHSASVSASISGPIPACPSRCPRTHPASVDNARDHYREMLKTHLCELLRWSRTTRNVENPDSCRLFGPDGEQNPDRKFVPIRSSAPAA